MAAQTFVRKGLKCPFKMDFFSSSVFVLNGFKEQRLCLDAHGQTKHPLVLLYNWTLSC